MKLKKEIGTKLFEEIAQSWIAIKNYLEMTAVLLGSDAGKVKPDTLNQGIKIIKEAVQDIRSLSIELRPPSLDDLGLSTTILAFCRDFQLVYPRIRLDTALNIDKDSFPATLKTLVYTIMQGTLPDIE